MVDQKSENFRTLTGNHGGLRRGTAAAALGAVLVLSAGVPASNAAAPALLADTEDAAAPAPAVSQLSATVSGTLSLDTWAGAVLGDEDDDEPSGSPTPTLSPTIAPAPTISPSTTPSPIVPVPTLPKTPLPTKTPTPAPTPSPTSTSTSGPSQTPSPTPTESRPGYSPAAVPPPAGQQPPAAGPATATQPAPAVQPAPAAPVTVPSAESPVPAAAGGASADRRTDGTLDAAAARPGAAGIVSGVWGSARLSRPMNMGTVDYQYSAVKPNSAVLGSSQAGPVSPLVWVGAGLVVLAGAAGLVAYKMRKAL